MIKLQKISEPTVLSKNSSVWLSDLLSAMKDRDSERITRCRKRYNHPDVKAALKQETREKCAYCEAKVTDVAHGDIEHVCPKSIDPRRTFSWENLTFSCQICNQNKSNKEDILDPYRDDPQDHFIFVGAFVKGRTSVGCRTVHELQLNRIALIESRNREIERYANEIEKAFLLDDERLKELILGALLDDLDTGRPEFIAACGTAVRAFS